MGWSSFTVTKPGALGKSKKIITKVVVVATMIGLVVGTWKLSQKNSVREKLPAGVQKSLLTAEKSISELRGDRFFVTSKSLRAKGLISKDQKPIVYKKGFAGLREVRSYRLNKKLKTEIEVETLPTAKIAKKMHLARSGTTADQLNIQHPSVIESHGLDDQRNYFMSVRLLKGTHTVRVTIIKELDSREKEVVMGPRYEEFMNQFADTVLTRVIGISQKQLATL